ncbi:MAG: bifunctional N-acetylglucosamine-1-phosphate uridyltransferase/glucosamine-1-phosphate acetyltransferase [Candidatus Goldiibacteriota bacterium]
MTDISAVILAAGEGTRMRSENSKVMHNVCGAPMLGHVIKACMKAGIPEIVVVAGKNEKEIKEYLKADFPGKKISTVVQTKRLGTAHAVKTVFDARKRLKKGILILSGDTPLITCETIGKLIKEFTKKNVSGIIGVSYTKNPGGYGRIITGENGKVQKIVEEKDAGPEEKRIKLVNGGVYIVKRTDLERYISKIRLNRKKAEYYLTDAAEIMAKHGKPMHTAVLPQNELAGVNNRIQLAKASKMKNKKVLEKMAENGITIVDFDTVFIEGEVTAGRDTVIKPFTVITGPVKIGKNCVIGPCAHIRPQTVIGNNCKIGNYVEVKKSKIGNNVNIAHLSYIGDAEIGAGTNIGAGTVTANYDGRLKHKTIIGGGVKSGSNVVFVAPVKIGAGSVVGAGSVITENVSKGSLVIARARQTEKKNKFLKKEK